MKYNEELLSNVDDYGYPYPPSEQWKARRKAIDRNRNIVAQAITVLMSMIGFCLWLRRLWKKRPSLRPQSFSPRRILVIRLDLIGDLVLSLTVVRALKRTYPEAEIDLLALPASASVASSDPHLAQIIPYDPNIWRRPRALLHPKNWRELRSLVRTLRGRDYDLAVSVYGSWAAALAVLSGAKRRVGYRSEGFPGFMTDNVAGGVPGRWRHWSPLDNKHEVDYCLELARKAGAILTAEDRIPRLYVNEQARQDVEQLLQREGVLPGKPLIVCHINSNNGQSKRWPIPYWALLIDRLIQKLDANIVLTGSPGDLPQIERVLQRIQQQENVHNLVGKTSLIQLAALLQRADLLISGDSGPLHMGVACGTPIVSIYGPTNPALGGPVSPDAIVLQSGIWCSPCYTGKTPADCPYYTSQCMKNILPAQVFAAVQEKLHQKQTSRGAGLPRPLCAN
jgi:lipopolysaccharide heptosyltransferase II